VKISLTKTYTKTLTKDEVQRLYLSVNKPGDWQIDVNSHELADKINELWFKEQGYDFWNNPYPDVTEWSLDNNELTFTYTYIV